MKSRVLYFPYVNVPESSWLTHMLLYWDRVSSIVPYDFIANPELLGPYMLNLVREELVVQISPGAYIHHIPRFFDAFRCYLEGLGQEIDDRRRRFELGSTLRIHIEKLGDIGEALVAQRLAALKRYPWYDVERETADDFMSYLATSLGQVDSIDSSPVTDKNRYLIRFARTGVPDAAMATQLDSLRIHVLDRVLPVPEQPLEASAIRAFKERYGHELADFRRHVERELVDTAAIADPALRERRVEIFFDEARDRIEEIQEAMQGAGWRPAKVGLSVIAAIPGVSPLFGLAAALWDAVTGGNRRDVSRDFAYAAHARAELAGAV